MRKRKISDAKLRKRQVSGASLCEHLARKKTIDGLCDEANRCFGLMSSGEDFVEGGSLWDGFFRAIATIAYDMALAGKRGFIRPGDKQ